MDAKEMLATLIAVRDDLLMRAKMNKRQNDGDVVVAVGNGVWHLLNRTIDEAQKGKRCAK